jgi:hypothetical protein
MAHGAVLEGMPFNKMPVLYSTLRLLGVPHGAGLAGHVLLMTVPALAVVLVCWKNYHRHPRLAEISVAAGCLLLPHHVNDYDYTLLALPMLALLREEAFLQETRTRDRYIWAMLLSWFLPAMSTVLAKETLVQVGWLAVAWMLWWCVRQARMSAA